VRRIIFFAEYDDGSTEHFEIPSTALARGDHVALMIARESQQEGRLKLGKIVRVYRDPAIAYLF
jgi:hypothetical protein